MENFTSYATILAVSFAEIFGSYFCFLPLVLLLALVVALALAVSSKNFRYADKNLLHALTSFFAFFHFAVATAASSSKTEFFVSLVIFALCFAVITTLTALSEIKIRLSAREKRLIDRLSGDLQIYNPQRRIEFLNGENSDEGENIEPNFNEIKKITAALRKKDITQAEEDELDKTEMDMEKFSLRKIQPYERKIFSERLLKIVKMTAKYEIDLARQD